jgi:hypothetical protein
VRPKGMDARTGRVLPPGTGWFRVEAEGAPFTNGDMDMEHKGRLCLLAAVVSAAVLLAGCWQTRSALEPVPMTTGEVVTAVNSGASESAILAQLRGRGYEGVLTTKDVDQLRAEGVPERVIDRMLTHPAPDVVVVRRAPRVTTSVGLGCTWSDSHRHRDSDQHRDEPKTRVYESSDGKRIYRYTSGK